MNSLKTPNFTTTGTHKKDYYLLNGSPDFAVIPENVIRGVCLPMPVRLPYGDSRFGAQHIIGSHGRWVRDNEPTACVATLVWRKLSQRGVIFVEDQSKINLLLRISPSALLILKQLDGFYSVTTMYHYQRESKGQKEGTYLGMHWAKKHVLPVIENCSQSPVELAINDGSTQSTEPDRATEETAAKMLGTI